MEREVVSLIRGVVYLEDYLVHFSPTIQDNTGSVTQSKHECQRRYAAWSPGNRSNGYNEERPASARIT